MIEVINRKCYKTSNGKCYFTLKAACRKEAIDKLNEKNGDEEFLDYDWKVIKRYASLLIKKYNNIKPEEDNKYLEIAKKLYKRLEKNLDNNVASEPDKFKSNKLTIKLLDELKWIKS